MTTAHVPCGVHVPAGVVVAGEAFALVATAWMLLATVALGRCFGILPEARGLVMHGPYRLVRHPLYLGELGACAGLAVASPSPRNLAAAVAFVLAQVVRMRMEELELARQFPEYSAYAERTPRLVPLRRLLADDGQALLEYVVILSLVSVVGIVALTAIGGIVNVDLSGVSGAF